MSFGRHLLKSIKRCLLLLFDFFFFSIRVDAISKQQANFVAFFACFSQRD